MASSLVYDVVDEFSPEIETEHAANDESATNQLFEKMASALDNVLVDEFSSELAMIDEFATNDESPTNNEPASNDGCWSIFLANEFIGRVKIGGCSCSQHESIDIAKEDVGKFIARNFMNNGVIVVEGHDHPPVFVKNDGFMYFKKESEYYPVINSHGFAATVHDKFFRTCLCDGCQQKKEFCKKQNTMTGLILSCGWFGLSFFGLNIL